LKTTHTHNLNKEEEGAAEALSQSRMKDHPEEVDDDDDDGLLVVVAMGTKDELAHITHYFKAEKRKPN